jgi:hypothetical protein
MSKPWIRAAVIAVLAAFVLASVAVAVAQLSRHQVCTETVLPETGPARVISYPCTAGAAG